jgi:DNA invertase Pin-like site-specific DNA recombinase
MNENKSIQRAATYLRSSKDRHDASIDAQRHLLGQMAMERGFTIVKEYADPVESGKDEDRPGFQKLLASIRNRKRGWDTLLLLDTSRLARRRHIALIFEEIECRKHGVRVLYKSLPDADPITEMLLKSILQAMDEWHSLTSKVKGLAGMAENVRQGWRAGGRAPMGYQLEHVETGAIRDGAPVVKSRLILSAQAPKVSCYLKARVNGVCRRKSMDLAGLPLSDSTAIGLEQNALVYAGHTVWNQQNEYSKGGYVGGVKRRPRDQWKIRRNTHEALISDVEAEWLITKLENSSKAHSRRTRSEYLLSGLLRSPDNTPWHGDGEGYYRVGKGKRIKAGGIEQAVLAQLKENLEENSFVAAFTQAARAQVESQQQDLELPGLKQELAEIERQIVRLTGFLGQTSTPDPLLRQMENLELRRLALSEEVEKREEVERLAGKVRHLTEAQVAKVMHGLAEDMATLDREALKDFLRGLLEKVELDVACATYQLTYRLNAGDRVASQGTVYK